MLVLCVYFNICRLKVDVRQNDEIRWKKEEEKKRLKSQVGSESQNNSSPLSEAVTPSSCIFSTTYIIRNTLWWIFAYK